MWLPLTGVDRLNNTQVGVNIAPTWMEGFKILPLMHISRGHDVQKVFAIGPRLSLIDVICQLSLRMHTKA